MNITEVNRQRKEQFECFYNKKCLSKLPCNICSYFRNGKAFLEAGVNGNKYSNTFESYCLVTRQRELWLKQYNNLDEKGKRKYKKIKPFAPLCRHRDSLIKLGAQPMFLAMEELPKKEE